MVSLIAPGAANSSKAIDSSHNSTDELPLKDEQEDDNAEEDEAAIEEENERQRRQREARAQALTLEIIGDLPYAEVKPPENVLFVCKLNPVTEGQLERSIIVQTSLKGFPDEDLQLIFSRFGSILSCEVIRDKRTGDSLQYAFIEFENQKDCEQAYFKMQGVLIDDHRIHVDFSQSVSLSAMNLIYANLMRSGLKTFGYLAKSHKFKKSATERWLRWHSPP